MSFLLMDLNEVSKYNIFIINFEFLKDNYLLNSNTNDNFENIQIEDLICQGELDYVERQMQMEDLLCVADAEAIERQMQMEDLMCATEAEAIERQIQMEDLLTHTGYGWR
jgi:hypothetical protein